MGGWLYAKTELPERVAVTRFRYGGEVITMAIRWINNYHRGFNRLWLIISVMIACFVVFGVNAWWNEKYRDKTAFYLADLKEKAKQKQSQKQSMTPTKFLESLEENPLPGTKEYEQAKLRQAERERKMLVAARWKTRALMGWDSLLTFLITFVIGHGCFCLVVWVIRGFPPPA